MKKTFLTLFTLTLILVSCQIQHVAVSRYIPPKVELPPELHSLLLTSRYVPATGPYEDVQWGGYETVDSIKWSISESLVDSLAKHLIAGNHFLVKVRHNPKMLKNNNADLPEQQPWDGMVTYAKKEVVQGVWILEGFELKSGKDSVNLTDNVFHAVRPYEVTCAVRLYEADKRRLVEDSVYRFSAVVEATGPSAEEALKALPNPVKSARMACSQAAAQYARLVLPGSVPAKRFYYAKGDSLLLVADTAVKKGNWGRAESKWGYMSYNRKDTTIQALASFNMALACERDGRLNQALGFARRSERLRPDRKTREYIAILEKELAEYQRKIKDREVIRNW
jgi:hypothetical protein